jgi:hypothetical protein
MMLGTQMPAWKRLGLKLKYASETTAPAVKNSSESQNGSAHVTAVRDEPVRDDHGAKKRKIRHSDAKPNGSSQGYEQRERDQSPIQVDRKKVSFSADTKSSSVEQQSPAIGMLPSDQKPPKKKGPKKAQQPSAQKSHKVLEYLDQFHNDKSCWKFNKNHETWLLKNALSEKEIPRSHDLALMRYIHGLRGTATRERLKAQCLEHLRKADTLPTEPSEELRESLKKAMAQSSESGDDAALSGHSETSLVTSLEKLPRSTLLLWALGENSARENPLAGSNGDTLPAKTLSKKQQKKNRTVVIDYNSSSDSDSGSSTESETGSSSSDTTDSDGFSDSN